VLHSYNGDISSVNTSMINGVPLLCVLLFIINDKSRSQSQDGICIALLAVLDSSAEQNKISK